MRKIIGNIAFASAVFGATAVLLTIMAIYNYVLFCVGLGMLITGLVGCLCTVERVSAALIKFFSRFKKNKEERK